MMLKYVISMATAMLLATSIGLAQQHEVSGVITDATSGELLPGVNISVDGTTIGTSSDLNGEYELTVPSPNETLLISFVGYMTQEVEVNGSEIINISLQPDVLIGDEIVVVGYTERRREELTGSVSTITGETLNITPSTSALGRLQGQVSGVSVSSSNTPGGETDVRIRGLGTINDSKPLYIIDGIPADPGSSLNPNNIESISVLKDASSTAIYGARGANGVVIIETKRGRENQPLSITYNTRAGINQTASRYDLLGPMEYGELQFLAARNQGLTPGEDWSHPQYGNGAEPRLPDYLIPAGAMEGDPNTDPDSYEFPRGNRIIRANKEGTDWQDEIYQNGLFQEHDLSLAGGSENYIYSFSGGWLGQEGIVKHSKFDRYSFQSNAEGSPIDRVKIGQMIQVSHTEGYGDKTDNFRSSVISNAYRTSALMPVYDIMGNYAGSIAPGFSEQRNPIPNLDYGRHNIDRNTRILGNFFGEAEIIEGLNFRSLLGYDYQQLHSQNRTVPDYYHTAVRDVPGAQRDNNQTIQWNWTNILQYTTNLGVSHSLNVLLGTEAVDNTFRWESASRGGYFSLDPDYMQISAGTDDVQNAGSMSEWSLFSTFGRVNYDLLDRYFFEVTVRRDGSSRFGPENRYGTFPAASFGWNISQEGFMAGTRDWLTFLKVRLGWGQSGNDRIGNYNAFTTFITHNTDAAYAWDGGNSSSIGFIPDQLGNRRVTWESTETINLGIEATVFDNIQFSFDLWERTTEDMLHRLRIPAVVGDATAPFVNIGEMQNKGFDIELGVNGTAFNGQFRYNVVGNISRYVNEITKLSEDFEEEIVFGEIRGLHYSRAEVGTPFPAFYGFIVDGIFQTQAEADAHPPAFGEDGIYNQPGRYIYRDLDGSGYVSDDDRTYIGDPHPDFTGGINIDLGYRNFGLNMFFYGSYGNDMINQTRHYLDFGLQESNGRKDALYRSWGSPHLESNEDATLPIYDFNPSTVQSSTAMIEDGSFLRLQSLKISYNIPAEKLERFQIRNIQVFGQATNVFTITNYSGLDPDLHEPGGHMGIDQGAWPTPRNIMLGLQFNL